MEKVYLQRIENQQDHTSQHTVGHKTQATGKTHTTGTTMQATKKLTKKQKPPAFREFQDRFVDQPDFIHKGQILEFESENQAKADRKSRSPQRNLRHSVPDEYRPIKQFSQ
jgi:hypothetical protein